MNELDQKRNILTRIIEDAEKWMDATRQGDQMRALAQINLDKLTGAFKQGKFKGSPADSDYAAGQANAYNTMLDALATAEQRHAKALKELQEMENAS